LRQRPVHIGRGRRFDRGVTNVGDDADDFRAGAKPALSDRDALADRRLVGPQRTHRGFVDQHDAWTAGAIGIGEVAAAHQSKTERR
jgi:hypothetical protein